MRTSVLVALTSLFGCTHALRARPPDDAPPLRHALGVPEPRNRLGVLGAMLAVHDSAPGSDLPVLVTLHAIGHGGGDFDGVARALAGRWRVVQFDWPGHGFSSSDGQPASATRYAALLGELLSVMRLERVVLLGNSIGGAAAVAYASEHPERVRGLVLANPGGLDEGASGVLGRWFIGRLVARFEQGAREEARFAPWFAEYYEGVLPNAPTRRAQIVAAGYESAPLLVQAWHSFMQPRECFTERLPKVKAPVLVAWAKRDEIIQWSRNEAAIETLPSKRVVFFDAGHAPFLEAPEAFNAELEVFLASLPADGASAAGSGAPE